MPISPSAAEDLTTEIARIYQEAETALLERLAMALEADIESPRWAELKLAAVGNLRTAVETVADALQGHRRCRPPSPGGGVQPRPAGRRSRTRGAGHRPRAGGPPQVPNASAVDRLAASMAKDTRPVYARITRAVGDSYRRVVARASGNVLLGTMTRRQAAQRALNQFAARGITGFVDRAGRSWDMASSAEMAVRSVTARAAFEGHVDALG
ncbi:phage minor capsid protein [Streptomyces griseosporeus]